VPTTVGFLAFGWLIVGMVFGRGEFGPQAQGLVALVLAAYAIGLVPSTMSRLLQNLFYALHETAVPARVATLRVAVSAAAGAGLMFWLDRYQVGDLVQRAAGDGSLRLGAVGLGLGASLGAWVELTLLVRRARAQVPELELPMAALAKMVGLAVAALAPAAALWWVLEGRHPWLLALSVLVSFAALYLGGAFALRFPEMRGWLGRLR
jgi:putative peptidoglycan lipid II flippase